MKELKQGAQMKLTGQLKEACEDVTLNSTGELPLENESKLTPAQKAFDVKTLKDANQMLADMKKQAAQNKDPKKAQAFKDSIKELEQTIEDIKAEQSQSESMDSQIKEFIKQAKQDGGNTFTDDESGDDVTVLWNEENMSYSVSVDRDEVIDQADEQKVAKFLKPYFEGGDVLQESLSKKLKRACESLGSDENEFPSDKELADDADCECDDEENCDCAELEDGDIEFDEAGDAKEVNSILTALNSTGGLGGGNDKYPFGNQELTNKAKYLEQQGKINYNKITGRWSKGKGKGGVSEAGGNTEAEWGFDLTSISDENWKKVLAAGGISPKANNEDGKWVWKGADVKIHTGNNPITGEYSRAGQRENEVGYASYIGVYGKKDVVKKVAKMISQLADGIKEETPNDSGFI